MLLERSSEAALPSDSFASQSALASLRPHVMKFGGTSVETPKHIRHVARIIREEMKAGPVGIVVSAVAGMTRLLANTLDKALQGEDFNPGLDACEDTHLDIAGTLFADHPQESLALTTFIGEQCDQAHNFLTHVRNTQICPDTIYAQIVGLGEILSPRILQRFLAVNGVDAAYLHAPNFIRTTGSLREGEPDMEETKQRFAALPPSPCYVMGGFIAADAQDRMSLLGWDGSDESAAIMACFLDAKICTLFKQDVKGIYTGDPRKDDQARLIPHLSFAKAHDMSTHGARVVHPGTLKFLQGRNIELRVRSTRHPKKPGTVIADDLRLG